MRRSDIDEYKARLGPRHLLVHYSAPKRVFGSKRIGLALQAFRQRAEADHMLVLSEDAGLTLASLLKFSRWNGDMHIVVHACQGVRRELFFKWADGKKVKSYITFCDRQKDILVGEIGLDANRVHKLLNPVDTRFFCSDLSTGQAGSGGYVFSCGIENRDYESLRKVAAEVSIPFVVQATGYFDSSFKDRNTLDNFDVRKERVSFEALRDLYHQSKFVVVPLNHVDYAAGVNSILEGMAMEKAVIVSDSPGMTDYFESDGVRVVPANDLDAMRLAIEELNASPELCARMGKANREWVVKNCEVSDYADKVTSMMTSSSEPLESQIAG